MTANFSGVESFRIKLGLIFQTLENCFKVGVDNKGNLELVLLESHEQILLRHIDPHCFVVCTIIEVFGTGLFAGKSLETVQPEVLLVSIATIAASK